MTYNVLGILFIGIGAGLVSGAIWLSRRTTFKQEGQRRAR